MEIRQDDILLAVTKVPVVINHGIRILVQVVAVCCDEMDFNNCFMLHIRFLL